MSIHNMINYLNTKLRILSNIVINNINYIRCAKRAFNNMENLHNRRMKILHNASTNQDLMDLDKLYEDDINNVDNYKNMG